MTEGFEELKSAFDMLWKVYSVPEMLNKFNKLARSILIYSPFTGDAFNEVGSMVIKYMQDTVGFINDEDKYRFSCQFCSIGLQVWARVLIHGYLHGISITDAFNDFRMKVRLTYI